MTTSTHAKQLEKILGTRPEDLNIRRRRIMSCYICGYDLFDGEALVVHHIDKNRKNNSRENLVLLCRNCHWLVHIGLIKLEKNPHLSWNKEKILENVLHSLLHLNWENRRRKKSPQENRNAKETTRVEKNRTDWFTIRENQFLEALKRFKRLKPVASELEISYRRAERILANIRKKWEWSVNTHNRLVAMCKRDQAFRKLLSKPAPRKPPTLNEAKFEEEEF